MNNSYDERNFYDTGENDDYDWGMCEKEGVVKFGSIATPVFFSLVIALSLIGNVLVLVILGVYEHLKSLTNIFILNLAISDLVFTAGLPFWAIYHIYGWIFSDLTCKIVTFVFFIGFYSSILFLTIMTIYRYLVVVHPLADLNSAKLRAGIFLSFLMWTISIAAAMPTLLHSSIIPVHHKVKDSWGCEYNASAWKSIAILEENVFFLVAFTVMIVCYIQILRRITGAKFNTKARAVRLVLCIVVVFFVSWVPYNVVIFLKSLSDHLIPPFDGCEVSIQVDYAVYVCRLIAFSHCCLNPVFYAFVGVKFRRHLKTIFRQIFRQKNLVDEQQVRRKACVSRGSMY